MTKIIIDTDIGDDVDDALALAYLGNSPGIEILGVTTVVGDTVKKAEIAGALLNALDLSHVPVYAGIGNPDNDPPCQYDAIPDGFNNQPLTGAAETGAAEFLVEMAEKVDNLTILTIGPLTNIGAAIKLNPEEDVF